jgi:nucleotide-binding universal stress UspA family protein
MKKFIAAFDGLNFSHSTMNYAIYMAKQCQAHLVGVFLEDTTRHSYSVADITRYEGADFDIHMHDLNEKDQEERTEAIEVFEQACQDEGVNYAIHRDRNVALQELLHESIYADLMIISSGETLTRYEEPVPTRFIRDLLNDVQCPVVLTPPKYKLIDKLILLYDGSPSSVHAVRTFSYLFEPMKNFDTEVISVRALEDSLHLPDNRLIKEFIKRHYPKAEYIVLKGLAEEEILTYLHRQKTEPLIVLGAYKRNRLSRLFRPSMADHLMQHIKMPLFIAHNKS